MKQTLIIMSFFCLLVFSVNVFAIGNIGAPTAELTAGQWSAGADYAYSDFDLDAGKMKYTDSEGGSGETLFDFSNIKTNFYYATLGYGITDNWEVFGRLGIADIKGQDKFPEYSNQWEGGNFDNDLVWGIGTMYTFYKQEKVSWGVTANMNWIDTSEDWISGEEKEEVDFSAYDLLVAVGPTVDMGGWKLYGGPFFYMFDGDFDLYDTYPAEEGVWWKGSSDVEADSSIGGYVGAAISLVTNADMTLEVATVSSGWAAGIGVSLRF